MISPGSSTWSSNKAAGEKEPEAYSAVVRRVLERSENAAQDFWHHETRQLKMIVQLGRKERQTRGVLSGTSRACGD